MNSKIFFSSLPFPRVNSNVPGYWATVFFSARLDPRVWQGSVSVELETPPLLYQEMPLRGYGSTNVLRSVPSPQSSGLQEAVIPPCNYIKWHWLARKEM